MIISLVKQSQHINTFFYEFGGGEVVTWLREPEKNEEKKIKKKKVHLVWHHHPDYAGLQRVAVNEDL